MHHLKSIISDSIQRQGLEFFGLTDLHYPKDVIDFKDWLDKGHQAGMEYLQRNLACREDPQNLLPGAKSAIVVGFNYFLGPEPRKQRGKIAQYARWRDYHNFMRKKLALVDADLHAAASPIGGPEFSTRMLVDSAPVLERALANKTGVGFIGKNSMFIHREKGSFFLLAEILTTLPLSAFGVESDHDAIRNEANECGTCKRCQTHCPTGALKEDRTIDANLCLSYWTIEHRGPIPTKFWPHIAEYIFGCDICQLVCPFNRGIDVGKEDLIARKNIETPPLLDIALMNQAQYELWFGGTPLTRAKREGLRRNALIALAVTSPEALGLAVRSLGNEADLAPVLAQTIAQIPQFIGRDISCIPCHTSETISLF